MKKGKDRLRAEPDREPKTQYAALPWRQVADGIVEVLLITSRESRRWVIPKGWPMRKLGPDRTAAQEAYEEAGVEGTAKRRSVGTFHYDKRLASGRLQHVRVLVFPLEVKAEKSNWPERAERERFWTSPAEASRMVDEPELRRILARFAP